MEKLIKIFTGIYLFVSCVIAWLIVVSGPTDTEVLLSLLIGLGIISMLKKQ